MRFLKESKLPLLLLGLIFFLYFAIRLPNLTTQPIFADEAIYIRWAQIMKSEPTLRFLPLSDGKTPLYMWVMIPLFKIFSDPLFAGRLLSVFMGVGTLAGVVYLGWRFFNKWVGIWAAFLIAITPYIVFFDRMALVDSALAAFSIWCLNFALLLVVNPRLDLAMILGYLLGGSMLTKTPGFFNIIALPFTVLLFNRKGQDRDKRIIKLFGFWLVAILIAMGIFNVLRLGPGFVNLNSRNQDYIHPLSRLLEYPLDPLIPHLRDFWEYLFLLIGLPILSLCLYGIGVLIYKRNKAAMVILLWCFFPLLVQMSLLKTFTARYLLFSIPALLLMAGYGAFYLTTKFRHKFMIGFLIVIILIWPIYFNYLILIDLDRAPLPANERRGYLEDWTAGTGLREIAAYLHEQSTKDFIVVGAEGFFGTLPDGLQIYFDKNRNVVINGSRATISAELRKTSFEHPTFFVTNKSRYPTSGFGVELLMEFPKAYNPKYPQDAMLLYRVLPVNESTMSGKVK